MPWRGCRVGRGHAPILPDRTDQLWRKSDIAGRLPAQVGLPRLAGSLWRFRAPAPVLCALMGG